MLRYRLGRCLLARVLVRETKFYAVGVSGAGFMIPRSGRPYFSTDLCCCNDNQGQSGNLYSMTPGFSVTQLYNLCAVMFFS